MMRVGWDAVSSSICWIDASSCTDVLARYINDPLLPVAYNVKFDKKPESGCAEVVATRDIAQGEEIYVDYGKDYWRGSDCKGRRMGVRDLGEAYLSVWERDDREDGPSHGDVCPLPPNEDIRRIVEMAREARLRAKKSAGQA